MDDMNILKEQASLKLGMAISDNDVEYLEKEWCNWLHDMDKYHNLTNAVKNDLIDNNSTISQLITEKGGKKDG